MHRHANDHGQVFFTRMGLIKSPETLLRAEVVRGDVFEKRPGGGVPAIRFVVTWLLLANGQIIPTVESAELLPLLEEVMEALDV